MVLLELRPDAVLLRGAADAGGELALKVGLGFWQRYVLAFGNGKLLGGRLQQEVDGPLPPAGEGGVVHGDFTGGVEDVPGLDLERDGGVDGLKEELKAV